MSPDVRAVLLVYILCAAVTLQETKGAVWCPLSERDGLTNSLKNLTCQAHAVDQSMDITKPTVILSWQWPLPLNGIFLNETSPYSLRVVYEAGGNERIITDDIDIGTAKNTTINLQEDAVYTFNVYFSCANVSILLNTTCTVNTFLRRTTVARRLSVSCSSDNSNDTTLNVEWISPEKKPEVDVGSASFSSVCLLGNHTLIKETINKETTEDDEVISLLELVGLDPGRVCLLRGRYILTLPALTIVNTPVESCGVPSLLPRGRAQLKLSCSNSEAAVEIITPEGDALNSSELHGKCITADLEQPLLMGIHEHDLKPGNTSISGLPDGTICSFFGTYRLQTFEIEDFEPTQCVVGHMAHFIPDTSHATTTLPPSPPTTPASPTTTYSTLMATSLTQNTLPRTSAAIIWVIAVVSVVILLAVVLAGGLAWMLYSSRHGMKQKIQQHMMWGSKSAEDLDQDPCVLPQFKYEPDFFDSLSVATQVEYLCKEGRPVLSKDSLSSKDVAKSPKVIMDRYLNACHQWEASHECYVGSIPPNHQHNDGKLNECGDGSTNLDTVMCESTNTLSPTCSHPDSHDLVHQHYITCGNRDGLESGCVHQVTTECAGYNRNSNYQSDYIQSSQAPDNYFTDDEGYLHVKDLPIKDALSNISP